MFTCDVILEDPLNKLDVPGTCEKIRPGDSSWRSGELRTMSSPILKRETGLLDLELKKTLINLEQIIDETFC